jgi:5-methyltetrahydrofolate--homocysteine methyltransferase
VKGDVHDIGKNIVGVILACNGFEVVDLGVMVPVEKILATIREQTIDIVCLSGLITPSLEEMCVVARAMQAEGLDIPLIVGGATTSPVHTAVKIAPCYEGPVFHVRDAASNPVLAMKLLDPATREQVIDANRVEQERIRQQQSQRQLRDKVHEQTSRTLGEASPLQRRLKVDWQKYPKVIPPFHGARVLPPILVRDLIPHIDWTYFFWAWRVKEDSEEGKKLRYDADHLLAQIAEGQEYAVRVTQAFYPAVGLEDRIRVTLRRNGHDLNCPCCNQTLDIPTPRQQKEMGTCLALCVRQPLACVHYLFKSCSCQFVCSGSKSSVL